MNKLERDIKATKGCIAKWEGNVAAERPGDWLIGPYNCPLCALYNSSKCEGCPIAEKTGDTHCEGTPYRDATDARDEWAFSGRSHKGPRAKARDAARAEVTFLKEVLADLEAQL